MESKIQDAGFWYALMRFDLLSFDALARVSF